MINRFNLNRSEVEKNEDFIKLHAEFNESNNKLLDSEFFRSVLGEKLSFLEGEGNAKTET